MPETLRWTAEMVRALPDDGNRYELVDGVLIVTPAPSMPHQRAVSALTAALLPYLQAVGVGYLFFPRMELSFGEDELLEPDLCVAPREKALAAQRWPDLDEMLLVVEVLSPSTRASHRLRKRKRYQRAAVPDYWVIDLDHRRSSGGARAPSNPKSSPPASSGSPSARPILWRSTSRRSSGKPSALPGVLGPN